jgi:hypothetical protein
MKPLPPRRYELGEWKLNVGVNVDYHLEFEGRYYSVPCELIGEKVDLRVTAMVIEVFRGGVRVTSHERSYGQKGHAVTKPEHRPRSHREFGDWPPERLIAWAGKAGPSAAGVVEALLGRGPHPESGRRACLGLVRMGNHYGKDRLEAACARALRIGNPTRKSVEAILKSGLDKVVPTIEVISKRVVHENIRGGAYFDREEPTAREEDEIEARYLEEERLGIMMGKPIEPTGRSPEKATMTLPELLERLKTSWSRKAPSGVDEADVSQEDQGEKE